MRILLEEIGFGMVGFFSNKKIIRKKYSYCQMKRRSTYSFTYRAQFIIELTAILTESPYGSLFFHILYCVARYPPVDRYSCIRFSPFQINCVYNSAFVEQIEVNLYGCMSTAVHVPTFVYKCRYNAWSWCTVSTVYSVDR